MLTISSITAIACDKLTEGQHISMVLEINSLGSEALRETYIRTIQFRMFRMRKKNEEQ